MHDSIQLSHDMESLRATTSDRLPTLDEIDRRLQAQRRRHGIVRRRRIVAGGVLAVCSTALAAPLLLESPTPPQKAAHTQAARIATNEVEAGRPSDSRAKPTKPAAEEARAKRDALRREIVRRVPATAAPVQANTSASDAPAWHAENKLGLGREPLVAFLNAELSPLLGECVEQASARAPAQTGMFAIGIETLAYEGLGAVVDVADPAPSNQVDDPAFFECVRESAFTLIIPPPLTSGQEKFELTGYFGQRE